MSDETNTTVTSTLPPISCEVVPFRKGGEAEQFSFTTKAYNTIQAAIDDLGLDVALDVINTEICARIGMKARALAGFPRLAEAPASERATVKNNLIASLTAKYPTKVIFSEEDALNWKPNTRELSLSGIQKKINEAYKNGDMAAFNLWIGQLQAAALRQQERMAAGL